MSLSMDGVSNYMNTQGASSASAAQASKLKDSVSGLSANSSEEELRDAVESFEGYMLEQVLKQVKKTTEAISGEKEKDSNSQLTDYYMDSTIQDIATTMVKQYGGKLTDELVGQMKRNLGVSDVAESDSTAATTETVV